MFKNCYFFILSAALCKLKLVLHRDALFHWMAMHMLTSVKLFLIVGSNEQT